MALAILVFLSIPALALAIWVLLAGPWCLLMYVCGAYSREDAWQAFLSTPDICLQIAVDLVGQVVN
jgi:hypothetical protein